MRAGLGVRRERDLDGCPLFVELAYGHIMIRWGLVLTVISFLGVCHSVSVIMLLWFSVFVCLPFSPQDHNKLEKSDSQRLNHFTASADF